MGKLELLDEIFPQTRREYIGEKLLESDLEQDPFLNFKNWLAEAYHSANPEPNAFSLATLSHGKPRSRILLLKAYYQNSPVFFTNYDSAKGQELENNNYASMLFFWPELMRQVRIEGTVTKLDAKLSDLYFASRPEAARIGAHASGQSKQIKNREEIEENYRKCSDSFIGQTIYRPKFWGGYVLQPDYFEFWQGGESRLHDRLIYEKSGESWLIKRLSP